jgi:hypothetical protein
MRRIFLLAAIVLFGIAIVVAAGTVFVTVWSVWICAGLAALALDKAINEGAIDKWLGR